MQLVLQHTGISNCSLSTLTQQGLPTHMSYRQLLIFALCVMCHMCACLPACLPAEGADPLAVVHDIMSRDLRPELCTMVLAAAAQKSSAT
jgi:hypothetical protein